MAKGTITVEGLDAIERSFQELGALAPKKLESALTIALQPIELAMKANARSMFDKGYSQGTMVKSISTNVAVRDNWVGASVGVFDLSDKVGHYGVVSGRIVTAPMIALFYETGIGSHYTISNTRRERRATASNPRGRRAFTSDSFDEFSDKRRDKGRGEIQEHPGSPPIPFLTSAWVSLSPQMLDDVESQLDKFVLSIL